MDVLEGLDVGEFLGVADELTGLDVDPPFGIDVPNAVDEDVVWGGTEGWGVVSEGEGHFVAVKDAGVVEAIEEVAGGPFGGTGVADAAGGVHCAIEEVEAVFISHSRCGNCHLMSAELIS